MEDIHTHLLYGIDDGSRSIEESLSILKDMEKLGIDEIVLTPHYVENSKYDCNNKEKVRLYQELMDKAEEQGIKIRIYLGNEVFITPNVVKLVEYGSRRKNAGGCNYIIGITSDNRYVTLLESCV